MTYHNTLETTNDMIKRFISLELEDRESIIHNMKFCERMNLELKYEDKISYIDMFVYEYIKHRCWKILRNSNKQDIEDNGLKICRTIEWLDMFDSSDDFKELKERIKNDKKPT